MNWPQQLMQCMTMGICFSSSRAAKGRACWLVGEMPLNTGSMVVASFSPTIRNLLTVVSGNWYLTPLMSQ